MIPNRADPGHPRASLVYLPPGVKPSLRYPGLYLLHGLRGSPYSFVGGLRLAAVADTLIHARRVHPFIAVMPPAGQSPQFDGEWTGAWERYVVHDVLPWSERHLPLSRERRARTLAGFSAGAYGAVDMGLRHPGAIRHARVMERVLQGPQGRIARERDAVRARGARSARAAACGGVRAARGRRALLPLGRGAASRGRCSRLARSRASSRISASSTSSA